MDAFDRAIEAAAEGRNISKNRPLDDKNIKIVMDLRVSSRTLCGRQEMIEFKVIHTDYAIRITEEMMKALLRVNRHTISNLVIREQEEEQGLVRSLLEIDGVVHAYYDWFYRPIIYIRISGKMTSQVREEICTAITLWVDKRRIK